MRIPLGERCVGFQKYDGSNLRWEWSRKAGWYKHGTRHRLFGVDEAPYNQAIPIFKEQLAETIEKIVRDEYKGITDFIVYTEFFGENSFAGTHVDEPKKLKLIDVWIPRKSFIIPKRFIALFGIYAFAPDVLYEGNLNTELISQVRTGQHHQHSPLHLREGMVCKGTDRRGQQWVVKIKTDAYLSRLRGKFGADWIKYV